MKINYKPCVLALVSILLSMSLGIGQEVSTESFIKADRNEEEASLAEILTDSNLESFEKNNTEAILPPPKFKQMEISAWYGVTFNDVENQNGIRRLDFKYEPDKKNLLFIFYDNALSFDNNFVAVVERNAPIVGVGAKHDWSKKWFTKIELGQRFLTTQDDQYLFNMENGYFFSNKFLSKLITQYDIRQDDNLLTLGGFIDFKVTNSLRLETGLFHAENLTFPDTFNQRFLVVPKFSWGKSELILGGYYDRYRLQDVSLNQFSGGYALFVFPLYKDLKGNVFFNYDKGFRNEITVISFGLNQKI